MWLSGLLLNSVPVKQSDTSCASERIRYVTNCVCLHVALDANETDLAPSCRHYASTPGSKQYNR